MRRISILTILVMALAALCFGAGEENAVPQMAVKPSVSPAAIAGVDPNGQQQFNFKQPGAPGEDPGLNFSK